MKHTPQFRIRDLLWVVLVLAVAIGWWKESLRRDSAEQKIESLRRSIRTNQQVLQWTNDAAINTHDKLMQKQAGDTNTRSLAQQERARQEHLLAEILSNNKQILQDLKID